MDNFDAKKFAIDPGTGESTVVSAILDHEVAKNRYLVSAIVKGVLQTETPVPGPPHRP